MKHFVVEISYRVTLARIEESSAAHRAYVQAGVDQGLILCAGPRAPRVGGVIVARANSLATLEAFFATDPYLRESLADYRYIEFQPLRHQHMLADWVGPA